MSYSLEFIEGKIIKLGTLLAKGVGSAHILFPSNIVLRFILTVFTHEGTFLELCYSLMLFQK